MKKRLFFLLMLCMLGAVTANVNAAAAPSLSQPSFVITDVGIHNQKPHKKKGAGLFARWKEKLVAKAIKKGWLGEGEMTEKQKRWAKWSMILGLGSLVLLFIPYISFVAIPAAIVALVLGIKSVEGNSNTQGIIGIIAGGLTLVLLILAIAVLVAFFASWN